MINAVTDEVERMHGQNTGLRTGNEGIKNCASRQNYRCPLEIVDCPYLQSREHLFMAMPQEFGASPQNSH